MPASRSTSLTAGRTWRPVQTFAEVAERHAAAIGEHFGKPVDVLGASTGGPLALQLIADRPDVVRKAVVACAAYTLGPLAKEVQLKLLRAIEETGRYPAQGIWTSCRRSSKLIMYRDRGQTLVTAPEFFSDVTAFLRGPTAS